MRALLLLALVLLGAVVALRLLLPRVVSHFIYYPEPLAPQEGDPRLWGFPRAEELRFHAADGVELHAWWFPARPGPEERCGAAVYLHGNAGHLGYRGEVADALSGLGLDVLLLDYRGYGLSGGRPDEEGLYRDAEAAYEVALEKSGVGPERLVAIGNSLGSAVAVELARRRPLGSLVLFGAFGSTVAVGRHALRWLPAWLLDWEAHRFDALWRIAEVRVPVLVVVGSEDRMIPQEEARRVYEAAAGPKRWYVAEGAGHNDLFAHEGVWPEVQRHVREALRCP